MKDRETVIDAFERCFCEEHEHCPGCYQDGPGFGIACRNALCMDVLTVLKEQEAKQYNNHEVACIIADLFGDPCACNFNDIDTWLPYKCDFRETCCPNPVGVACWEQYLKHKEGRGSQDDKVLSETEDQGTGG